MFMAQFEMIQLRRLGTMVALIMISMRFKVYAFNLRWAALARYVKALKTQTGICWRADTFANDVTDRLALHVSFVGERKLYRERRLSCKRCCEP